MQSSSLGVWKKKKKAYVRDHEVKHTCISACEKPTCCVIPYEEVILQSIIFWLKKQKIDYSNPNQNERVIW